MDKESKVSGLFQKLGSNKLVAKIAARSIDKEEFLNGLREAQSPLVSSSSNTEEEVGKAFDRIGKSGYKEVFDSAGITEDDLRSVIESIKSDKPETYSSTTPKVGRNELCPCGSRKKYKRCCGNE